MATWPTRPEPPPSRVGGRSARARLADPRAERFAPLFVAFGTGEPDLGVLRTVIDGYWSGIARRSVSAADRPARLTVRLG
ncbi:hypothetical protein [Nocardia abscessus]|uniref:hypothetical protein n=1 Tax=Nocardia abscessus TaxID=120957 RepID=UPI002456672F|nr:hypothetical protein [Nocardia abscessus]